MKRKRLTCREKSVLRSAGKLLPHEVERLNREIREDLGRCWEGDDRCDDCPADFPQKVCPNFKPGGKEDYDEANDGRWDEICGYEGVQGQDISGRGSYSSP